MERADTFFPCIAYAFFVLLPLTAEGYYNVIGTRIARARCAQKHIFHRVLGSERAGESCLRFIKNRMCYATDARINFRVNETCNEYAHRDSPVCPFVWYLLSLKYVLCVWPDPRATTICYFGCSNFFNFRPHTHYMSNWVTREYVAQIKSTDSEKTSNYQGCTIARKKKNKKITISREESWQCMNRSYARNVHSLSPASCYIR